MAKVSVSQIVEPYSIALLTRVLGFTYQEAQEYMEKVRMELANSNFHLYYYFHFVYGQRPIDDTTAQR